MSKKKQTEKALRIKRIIVIISVVLVILITVTVGIGALSWWATNNRAALPEPVATQEERNKVATQARQAATDGKRRDEATQAIKDNNFEDAEKLYAEAIEAAATAERKTQLYVDLSAVYYAEGRYEEAFAAAKKADDINSDKFLMADWLSRLYEDRKEYKEAANYYKLAGEWADSNQNKTNLTKTYYNGEAERVMRLETGQ
jgi:tetratricopeptide (TPR) repeat protein